MNRRIFRVILLVTAFALIGLGIPLAVVIRQVSHDQAVVSLEREAARASQEVPRPAVLRRAPVHLPTSSTTHYALYDTDGERVAGKGPSRGDRLVHDALDGRTRDTTSGGRLEVAVPVTRDERVFAVMWASRSLGPIRASVLHKWLLMGALGVVILAIAAAAARWEARRLSRPVEALAVAVTRLGEGDFTVRAARSGIPEIDQAAGAVDVTAQRLGQLIERERSFSADASHQLRTPLTGLRLRLENALAAPTGEHTEALEDALGAVERLEDTVVDLLALARDSDPERQPLDVAAVVTDQARSWHPLVSDAGRQLMLHADDDLPLVRVSPAAVRQVLDVLVSNALIHGGGAIGVTVTETAGAVALDVTDEGSGINGDAERVFQRGEGEQHGIGLSLARSLAEAEGGRLLLREPGPHPRFSLLLPAENGET